MPRELTSTKVTLTLTTADDAAEAINALGPAVERLDVAVERAGLHAELIVSDRPRPELHVVSPSS